MKKLAFILWAFLLPTIVYAQSPAGITFLNANGGRTTVGVSDPLPVSGTFTPSGSSPTYGPIAASAATATKAEIIGCQYLSALPTYSNTQQGSCTFDINGRLLVSNLIAASRTARGTTITAGGTSQTLMASNGSRKGFTIQNPCSATTQGIVTVESLFINFTSAATVNTSANVAELPPCSSYSEGLNGGVVTQETITIIGATTSHIIYAKEF